MRFGFNYGMGAGSSRYRNSFVVSYLMDTIYTDDAMDRFLDNVGSNGSNNDAVALASNHIYLNGTTQSVPYPVLHDSGADTKQTATLGTGWVDNTGHSYTATNATSDLSALSSASTDNVLIDFTISNYSAGDVNGKDANGTYQVSVTNDSLTGTSFSGDVLINSAQEITLPTASYLTIMQADGTIKQLSSTGDVGEPIVDDDFNDGTVGDWYGVSGGSVSNVNNTLQVDGVLDDSFFYSAYAIPTEVGRRYSFSVDMLSSTTTSVRVGSTTAGSTDLYLGANSNIPRTDTGSFVATTTTSYFILVSSVANVSVNFDNVIIGEALHISTTYNQTDSHQFVLNHTSPLTDADVSAIEADPNLAFRMFYNGEVLPSGFSRANDMVDCNFYGGNEGLASGNTVYNLARTFTSRATTGTYIDGGVLKYAAIDEARYEDGFLLSEKASENLVTYSETFTTSWSLGGTTVTFDKSFTSPDGTLTASKMTEGVVDSYYNIFQSIPTVIGNTYSRSVFAKSGSGNRFLYLRHYNGNNDGVYFNLENGTIELEQTGMIGFIRALGDGWYECGVTNITNDTTDRIQINMVDTVGSAGSYQGDGTSHIYIWGAQFEHGETTSYIPTTTTAVTRSADLPDAEDVAIVDYNAATRTTLANQSKGASNLKLIKDGSGRTTGVVADDTTRWYSGDSAPTRWTVIAPYTITEIIGADTYTFTSDLNRYKNGIADGTFTAPTGVWTLGELAFDGATPTPSRGKIDFVDAVVIP